MKVHVSDILGGGGGGGSIYVSVVSLLANILVGLPPFYQHSHQ